MKSAKANINIEVLCWARGLAGYSPEEAARKLQVKPERYQAWELVEDDTKPTIKQLRRIAKLFRRPVSVFYLPEPPEGFMPMRDFRRLPGDGLQFYSPQLLHEMELAQQRRELALELLADLNEEIPEFNLTATLSESPEEVGNRIRHALGITFADQMQWRQRDAWGPFKAWRSALEAQGVLVFQMSRVERTEVSGFAVAEKVIPLIAVNRKDVPNRRTFSLLHEFVHILLHLSGASELNVDVTRPPEEQEVEVFCNSAAASALMPREYLLGQPIVQTQGPGSERWSDDELYDLAGLFGVSREAVLRRLLTYGRTTQRFYQRKSEQFNEEFLKNKEREKQRYKESAKKFRKNPPQDVFVELGRPFVRLVLDSARQDFITLNEASGYLGNLRIRHFPKLEERVYNG